LYQRRTNFRSWDRAVMTDRSTNTATGSSRGGYPEPFEGSHESRLIPVPMLAAHRRNTRLVAASSGGTPTIAGLRMESGAVRASASIFGAARRSSITRRKRAIFFPKAFSSVNDARCESASSATAFIQTRCCAHPERRRAIASMHSLCQNSVMRNGSLRRIGFDTGDKALDRCATDAELSGEPGIAWFRHRLGRRLAPLLEHTKHAIAHLSRECTRTSH